MKINPTMLAYMAGIIDGEGCITIGKQIRKNRISPSYRSSITVSNTDRRVIDLFAEYFGGQVAHRKDNRIEKKWADSYTWYCPDSNVVSLLSSILPYLIIKKEQAVILIDYQLNKSKYKHIPVGVGKNGLRGSLPLTKEEIEYKDGIWQSIKMLNSKGVFSRKQKMIV